ncbi:hypothetical protein [Vibrio breoganii]|uniref:hypothetical protein n=1 Tax=Vibrio breoganii TaxID=553239 RepID=UPI0002F1CC97|nr:hypothetical protein [Vibrio breoganii]OED95196.1 hypothetical protein A1QE_15935 [Vibrio breoganii ZF-55]
MVRSKKLDYKNKEEGFLAHLFRTFDEVRECYVIESQKELARLKQSREKIADLFDFHLTKNLADCIKYNLLVLDIEADLYRTYSYKGEELSLVYYLKARGTLEENPDMLGVSEDINALQAIAIASLYEEPISPSLLLGMYECGLYSGTYRNYGKLNRKENFEKPAQDAKSEKKQRMAVIHRAALSLWEENPKLTKTDISHLLSNNEKYGNLKQTTVFDYLKSLRKP